MQSYEGSNERGLVYGFVLDGEGGARRIQRNELEVSICVRRKVSGCTGTAACRRRSSGCVKPAV